MRIVVAIGGNALIAAGDDGTWDTQLAHALRIAEEVVALRAGGHELVLTHGNGPQVGALALQQESADLPELPLDALTAMTQGQIGYLLETSVGQVYSAVPTATLLTRVLVDPDDPAFDTPTKPVGPFYDGERARALTL
jgi:carbamate kinase